MNPFPFVQTFHQKPNKCYVTVGESLGGGKLMIEFDTPQQALDYAHQISDVVNVHVRP